MAVHVGQQLGNYLLLRLLGKGGYAEVYLGQHLYLNNEAAIKIFPSFVSKEDREAFLREAQLMARLRHPHIVRILEGSVEQSVPFLVMDYAPHGTLRDLHPGGEQLAPETVLEYVKQIAAALDYAHQQRLVHRDLKPGNLLLGHDKEVLLSDFGLAVAAERSHTQPRSEVAGTVAYMAPEQIEGKPSPSSDQYSLGIVIYEWLSGSWPFQGAPRDIVVHHLGTPAPSLRSRVPSLPVEIDRVILRALAKKPAERYSSVLEFAAALEQAIQQARAPRFIKLPSLPITQPKVTPNLLPPLRDPGEAARVTPDQLSATPRTTPPSHTHPTLPAPTEPAPSPPPRPPAVGTALLTYRGHNGPVTALAWSPGGKRLASGAWDGGIHLWDTTSGSRLLLYEGHTAGVTTVAWSPDKKLLASGSDDGAVQVWDAASGQLRFTYRGHPQSITALAWSPDASYLASASTDQIVHIWKPDSQIKPLLYKGHRALIEVILWSADRKRITTIGSDQTVQRWDTASGGNVLTSRNRDAPARTAAWSPDGAWLAVGREDGAIALREAASGKPPMLFRSHTREVLIVAWSPGGSRLASGSADQTVKIWQAR